MKQEPAEAIMRSCHGSAVGIFAINGEEDVKERCENSFSNVTVFWRGDPLH
jgi:hypothetical protein